jgi:hypothetical protein
VSGVPRHAPSIEKLWVRKLSQAVADVDNIPKPAGNAGVVSDYNNMTKK